MTLSTGIISRIRTRQLGGAERPGNRNMAVNAEPVLLQPLPCHPQRGYGGPRNGDSIFQYRVATGDMADAGTRCPGKKRTAWLIPPQESRGASWKSGLPSWIVKKFSKRNRPSWQRQRHCKLRLSRKGTE